MFITCGEALFDLFTGPHTGGNPHGISIDGVVGGSPLNVALGLARMGNRANLFTRISTDSMGQKIRGFMTQNNVSDRYCVTTDQLTTLAMVSTGPDGHPQYSIYTKGTADCSMEMSDIPQKLDDLDRVIHLGSFATALEGTGDVLKEFARREKDRRFITYDPNIRLVVLPDLDRWRLMNDEMLPIAGFVKASDEDLSLMYPGKALEEFIADGLTAGADVVCVTRGPEGVIIGSADGRLIHIAGRKVDVKDTVGAGDTFQAACLHYLGAQNACEKGKARDVDLEEMGRFATAAAALTCSRRGADLPSLKEIEAFGF